MSGAGHRVAAGRTSPGIESSNLVIDGDVFPMTSPSSRDRVLTGNASSSTAQPGTSRFATRHFYNCETYALYFTSFVAAHQYNGNILIENNWFGRTCCFGSNPRDSAINLGGASPGGNVRNLLIRFNSFGPGQSIVREGGGGGSNIRVVGNILGYIGGGTFCISDVSYAYNVWSTGGTCGVGGVNVSPLPYVDPSTGASGNYHLAATTAIDNLVPQTADSDLATDRDGQGRTAPRDAGSDER